MNGTIMTNDEWAVGFMEQLDTMLDGIESMNEKSKASFGNERFLTDKEVSGMAQGEPTYLAGLSQQWYGILLSVGRQDSLQGI